MTLNLLNGMAMYEFFNENCALDGELIPFNEAMCEGSCHENIFSSDFIEERCVIHMCEYEDYENLVIKPLFPLINGNFDELILWFDEDMFCQMNLITLLAFIDKNDLAENVMVNFVDSDYNLGYSVQVSVKNFYNLYVDVLVLNKLPNIPLPKTIQKGIELYFNYKKDDNEITQFIKENLGKEEFDIVDELIEKFPDYGLGDNQYLRLIDKVNNRF